MKTPAFVDTSAGYALIDRADPDHQAVTACLKKFRGVLVTSNFVFDEVLTLLHYRLGWDTGASLWRVHASLGALRT